MRSYLPSALLLCLMGCHSAAPKQPLPVPAQATPKGAPQDESDHRYQLGLSWLQLPIPFPAVHRVSKQDEPCRQEVVTTAKTPSKQAPIVTPEGHKPLTRWPSAHEKKNQVAQAQSSSGFATDNTIPQTRHSEEVTPVGAWSETPPPGEQPNQVIHQRRAPATSLLHKQSTQKRPPLRVTPVTPPPVGLQYPPPDGFVPSTLRRPQVPGTSVPPQRTFPPTRTSPPPRTVHPPVTYPSASVPEPQTPRVSSVSIMPRGGSARTEMPPLQTTPPSRNYPPSATPVAQPPRAPAVTVPAPETPYAPTPSPEQLQRRLDRIRQIMEDDMGGPPIPGR